MMNRHINLLISQHNNTSTPHSIGKPEFTHLENLKELKDKLEPLHFLSNVLRSNTADSSVATMSHRMSWQDVRMSKNEPSREHPAGEFVWIDLKDPTGFEREEVLSWFSVHMLTREKVQHIPHTDRLEYFPSYGYLFLVLTSPNLSDDDDSFGAIIFLLFESVLLTMRVGDFAGEVELYASVMECMSSVAEKGGMSLSSIFGTVVVNAIKGSQSLTPALMLGADYLNELVLQIMPSQGDHEDLMKRIRTIRHNVARLHVSLLLKERVLKQLLLPLSIDSLACRSADAVERYQGSLNLLQATIEKLSRTRDTINASSLNLVSGVATRLVSRCNVLDYINNVQTEMSLVLFPTALIPSLWTCNIMVPWRSGDNLIPFYCIFGITLLILVFGLAHPLYKFYAYKPPKALVPEMD